MVPGGDFFVTVSPGGGQFEQGEQSPPNVTEYTDVVVTAYTRIRTDSTGHDQQLLQDLKRGLLTLKRMLLKALVGQWLNPAYNLRQSVYARGSEAPKVLQDCPRRHAPGRDFDHFRRRFRLGSRHQRPKHAAEYPMITYCGIPLLLPDDDGKLIGHLDSYLAAEGMRWFGAETQWQASGRAHGRFIRPPNIGLPTFNYSDPPHPRLNQLYIPTGATRWSCGLFLVDQDSLKAIQKYLKGQNSPSGLPGRNPHVGRGPAVPRPDDHDAELLSIYAVAAADHRPAEFGRAASRRNVLDAGGQRRSDEQRDAGFRKLYAVDNPPG